MKKKILIFTANRSGYGILRNIINSVFPKPSADKILENFTTKLSLWQSISRKYLLNSINKTAM